MNLADALEEATVQKTGNPVEGALGELNEQEREAWLNALDAGQVTQRNLALLLSQYSGHHVRTKQVSDYKRRGL